MAKGKRLTQLLTYLDFQGAVKHDHSITGLAIDSREVQSGDMFLALAGHQKHGLEFAQQAEQQGAAAIFAETPIAGGVKQPKLNIPVYEIEGLGQQLGPLAAEFFNHPGDKIKVMAVTGTNGKTSTAWLLVQALQELGIKSGYMGTLGVGSLNDLSKLKNTTPSALHIQSYLAEMVSRGFECVCLEASSHALVQGRLNGLRIDTAILTNISQDHLDYHKTMDAYADAKQRLFNDFELRHAVINSDDDYGQQWLQSGVNTEDISVYGQRNLPGHDHHSAQNIELKETGICFQWHHNHHHQRIQSQLLGRFNIDNLLAVMATLIGLNVQAEDIVRVIPELTPVPGRMNIIIVPHKQVTVVIDFAHTPDALKQVLSALAAHCRHELWCVFGCGGDRDESKRPKMGQIAEHHADHVIVTDDNPRFESAAQIAADIARGMTKPPVIIHNRRSAIEQALQKSVHGDVVLIAGKGHETTQQINDQYLEFNDFQVVQDWQEAAA